MLTGITGRHVIYKTGVADVFRIHSEYLPAEFTSGQPPNDATVTDSTFASPPGPAIFAALEKMGLILVRDKGQQGYIVIDHVERPSEN